MSRFGFPLVILLCLIGCAPLSSERNFISIQWNDSVPSGLIIPQDMLERAGGDLSSKVEVRVAGNESRESILGDLTIRGNTIVFTPLVPFTRALTYEVSLDGDALGAVTVPPSTDKPTVASVYPGQDSVPENLLKMYVRFSHPMREANPMEFVKIIDSTSDTLGDVFLELSPPLWNDNGTLLTLWLDPGRIKRDLQPNQRMGPPLRKGESYTFVVSAGWPSKEGARLDTPYVKKFVVVDRDETSPVVANWRLDVPSSKTRIPLYVHTGENLDAIVLMDAMTLTYYGSTVKGTFTMEEEESVVVFTPSEEWKPGVYMLSCERRLEDLAGNNLDRLFDQDVAVSRVRDGDSDDLAFTVR